MLVLTRTHIRPNTKTPFFLQLATDHRPWTLDPLYIRLKSRMKVFEGRFSKDVLTKVVIFEFADQECYDEWKSEPHNMIRAQALSLYNSTRFITTTDDVKIMDDPTEYYQGIVSTYFATKCFKLARLPGDAQDSFVEDGSITDPSVDPIELDPWFKNLASA